MSKRDDESEGRDIVNYLRRQFSDTIGGAVVLGVIDRRKRLIYYTYQIDRSGSPHHTNWSVTLDDRGLVVTHPDYTEPQTKKHFVES